MASIVSPTQRNDIGEFGEKDLIRDDGSSGGSKAIDGMASLTIDDRDGGYLGIASGAALLRLLWPSRSQRGKSAAPKLNAESNTSKYRPGPSWFVPLEIDPRKIVADTYIDMYFGLYHVSYPLIHEPSFRAQYSEIIPRPDGDMWKVLANLIAAVGAFTVTPEPTDIDLLFFGAAKAGLSIECLETGNFTLVQSFLLMSNYLQKKNKPNSGYNYAGLALRMAMGLGLHKEFKGWNITPLKLEARRRLWWGLFIMDSGATVTFSRPLGWPSEPVEVALPLNIHDRDLTPLTQTFPKEFDGMTVYTRIRAQVSFHLAVNGIYTRVISIPFPTSSELIAFDNEHIVPWLNKLPPYYQDQAAEKMLPKYALAHAVMMWRYHNFRIIMYRSFVIRRALQSRGGHEDPTFSPDEEMAYQRCLSEAHESVVSIDVFWSRHSHTKKAAWYALYFLFQASLIPIICLRNEPLSPRADGWRADIHASLHVVNDMEHINPNSRKCANVIHSLTDAYMQGDDPDDAEISVMAPTEESPQTQINHVYPMMWPNIPSLEVDVSMQDSMWTGFLAEGPDHDNFEILQPGQHDYFQWD